MSDTYRPETNYVRKEEIPMKKFDSKLIAARNAIANKSAEAYVDTGVKILIAVVVGALLLVGLVALFQKVIMPTVQNKVTGMFNSAPNAVIDINGGISVAG
jgi:hypothetical protein